MTEAQQNLTTVYSKVMKHLQEMTKQMKRMESKLGNIEKDIQFLKKTKADKVDDRRPCWSGQSNAYHKEPQLNVESFEEKSLRL